MATTSQWAMLSAAVDDNPEIIWLTPSKALDHWDLFIRETYQSPIASRLRPDQQMDFAELIFEKRLEALKGLLSSTLIFWMTLFAFGFLSWGIGFFNSDSAKGLEWLWVVPLVPIVAVFAVFLAATLLLFTFLPIVYMRRHFLEKKGQHRLAGTWWKLIAG